MFKDKNEAFNHYRTATAEVIETRAAEIGKTIDADANADIAGLNIELDGLKMAKDNLEQRSAAQNKLTGFNPITGKDFENKPEQRTDDIFSSMEYRNAFSKKMLNKPMSADENAIFERAQNQAQIENRSAFISTGNSTAVIPTTILNEVVQKATTQGNILQYVRQFNIPANLSIPVATPEDAAEWHTEGAAVTPSTNEPAHVVFNAYELMKVFSMSVAANVMTLSAFESYLSTELSRTVYAALNNGVFNGTGTNQAQGILAAITWDTTNSATFATTGLKYADVLKLASLLKAGYAAGAIFAVNNATLFNRIMAVEDTTGRPIFTNPIDGGAGRMLGHTVVVDDYIPTDTILFGNFQYYGLNLSQGIMLEVSRESSFKQGLIDYRAMAVADGKVIIPEAFCKLTLATA
ncbi:MAG: phage major capsid protein [Bacillota bacterium]|nr:phage major capsid protein [Bacillota bacterium]